jgi:hypothetical protein
MPAKGPLFLPNNLCAYTKTLPRIEIMSGIKKEAGETFVLLQ